MNPLDVRTATTHVSFRGAQLAAEHAGDTRSAARGGANALPAYTSAQVAAMARARLQGPRVNRPALEMTTAVMIAALIGMVLLGLGLIGSGAFAGSAIAGLGIMLLGAVQLALILRARNMGVRGATASGGEMLREAGLCDACAATLRPGALACDICGSPTSMRDASGAIVSGVPVVALGAVMAGSGRSARVDPPLAASTLEWLKPTIWMYDGLERAVPTAARLPFVSPSDPDVAKRWAEARATLEMGAQGRYPKAIVFLAIAVLLVIGAVFAFAISSNGAAIVLLIAAVYLVGRAAMFLLAWRISSERIRDTLLEKNLCPCCVSDLSIAGQFVTSKREATRCVTCGCLWYPLHGELRYFATRITACRWCGYGIGGLAPDQLGLIRCPECGKRGPGPLHVQCGKCGALVPMTPEESETGWMHCANCNALNMVGPLAGHAPSGLEDQWTDDASVDDARAQEKDA